MCDTLHSVALSCEVLAMASSITEGRRRGSRPRWSTCRRRHATSMDATTVAKLVELQQLQQAGVLSAAQVEKAQDALIQKATATADDELRAARGLPIAAPVAFHVTGSGGPVFPGAVVNLGSNAGATTPPQQQLAPPPPLRPTLALPAGPSPQQVQAEAQLAALQAQQQQQQAQQQAQQAQMEARMAQAQAALSAAAAAPSPAPAPATALAAPAVAAPQGKTKSTSADEKLQLQPKPKKQSEKQSTDMDSKGKPLSSQTTRRAIVVMFCDICDSTAMSEALDAEDVREVVLVYQHFVGEVLVSLGGHIAQYLGDGILTYFGTVSF